MNRISIIATLLCLGTSVVAQDQCEQRLMIPIHAHGVLGNYGSIWESKLAITNNSPVPVRVLGHGECSLNPCVPPSPVEGDSTIFPEFYTQYLTVECARVDDVSVQLRIQDRSRQSETWGTAIPVVREGDLFDGTSMNIVDVPNTPEFRSMLRVYGFDANQESRVTIRILELDDSITGTGGGDDILVEFQRVVTASPSQHLYPAVVEIPLWTIPELASGRRLRLEITGDHGHRLWSFVSATNNATQHVTVLTPQ